MEITTGRNELATVERTDFCKHPSDDPITPPTLTIRARITLILTGKLSQSLERRLHGRITKWTPECFL